MPEFRKNLNRRLTADISHWIELISSERVQAATNEEIRTRVGRWIRKYREQCGWNQAKLAEKAKLSRDSVIAHEHGRTLPYADTLQEYCTAFNAELGLKLRPIDAKNA